MKTRFWGALFAIIFAVLSPMAYAQDSSDEWKVGPVQLQNGKKAFCRALSPKQNGMAVRLQSYYPGGGEPSPADRGAGLIVFIVDGENRPAGTHQISVADVRIDPGYGKRTRALWNGLERRATLSVPIEDYVDQMIKPFGVGETISIAIKNARTELRGKTYSVELKGSYEAMIKFEKCLSEVAG